MKSKFYTPRESLIPAGAVKVADKQSDAVAYLYERNGRIGALVFFGKQAKPVSHYLYKTATSRELSVAHAFESRRKSLAIKTERHAKRTAWVPTYKVGDIFRTCWGYDQTNVEYFELTEARGKYGTFREIAQARVETGFMQGNCVPLPGKYLEPRHTGDDAGLPIRRLLQEHGIKIDDVRYARLVPGENVAGVRVINPSSWSSYA